MSFNVHHSYAFPERRKPRFALQRDKPTRMAPPVVIVQVLLRAHVNLRDERQRVELTSLLSDLFDQLSGIKR